VCSPFSVKKINGMLGGLEGRGSAKVGRTSFVMALRQNCKGLWSVQLDFAVQWLAIRHIVSTSSGRQMPCVSILPPLDTRRTAPRYVPSFLRPAGPLLPGLLQERTAAELCAWFLPRRRLPYLPTSSPSLQGQKAMERQMTALSNLRLTLQLSKEYQAR